MKWVHTGCLSKWMLTVSKRGQHPSKCELCKQRYTGVQDFPRAPQEVRIHLGFGLVGIAGVVLATRLPTQYTIIICACYLLWWICTLERTFILGAILVGLAFLWRMFGDLHADADVVHGLRPGVALCHLSGRLAYIGNPFFMSVVLLTDYSQMGAVGFIVNKPFDSSTQAPPGQPIELRNMTAGYGGPVRTSRGAGWAVVHAGGSNVHGARDAGSGFWVGGNRTQLQLLAASAHYAQDGKLSFHGLSVHGYAGWAPRQLDREVLRGSWSIHDVTPELVFNTRVEDLWYVVCALPTPTSPLG